MLSLRNKRESFTLLNTPIVLFILIIITILRIYSLYVSPIELSVDEAQYWHWSRNIDFGYFTKPPLIAWLIVFDSYFKEGLCRFFFTHYTFIYFLSLGNQKFKIGSKSWKIAALIWYSLIQQFIGGFIISTDTPLLLFWSLSLLFLLIFVGKISLHLYYYLVSHFYPNMQLYIFNLRSKYIFNIKIF